MNSFPMIPSPEMNVVPPLQTSNQQRHSWMFTIPSDISWSSSNFADSVVTFTGKPIETQALPPHQFKRKGHHLDSATPPNKLYISEEKMVARMKELNISNCETVHNENDFGQSSPHNDEIELALDCELKEVLPKANEPILVLSQELKNMSTSESILPPTIIEKLQKPSMELVLWKPPEGIVGSLIQAVKSRENFMSKTNNNCMDEDTSVQTKKNLTRVLNSSSYLGITDHLVTEDKMEL